MGKPKSWQYSIEGQRFLSNISPVLVRTCGGLRSRAFPVLLFSGVGPKLQDKQRRKTILLASHIRPPSLANASGPLRVKISKIGTRGFRGQKTPISQGRFESINPHFPCGALWRNGIF